MNNSEIYLSAVGEVLLYIVGGILFIVLAFVTSSLLRPNRPNPQKLSTYESGEDAISSAWTQYNARFYIVALIFLLFEVEIVFLFPWTTIFVQDDLLAASGGLWGWFSVVEVAFFILVLALGLAYAWVNGHLDWIKPEPAPTPMKSSVPPELYERINERYAGTYKKES